MRVFLHLFLISVVLPLRQFQSCPDDQCRILAFPSTLFFVGERLVNHTITNISVTDRDTCEYRCYLDYNCVSVNFYFGEKGAEEHNCELNNSTAQEHDKDLVEAANYVYHGTKNFCAQRPCKNNGTCQSGFTRKRYRCLCASGFTGHDCDVDIDECAENIHNCSKNNATCTNSKGSFKCSCNPGFRGDGCNCTDIDECSNGSHVCDVNANCTNTEGSHNCTCKEGYIGNGKLCQAEECLNYSSLTSADRKTAFRTPGLKCDMHISNGWYRFQGAAGTKMPTTCPPIHRCRTHAPGWLNGVHPTVAEGQVTRQVCFHWSFNCCFWSTNIQVRNCGSYYVYNLSSTLYCYSRYCSTD